MRGNKKNINIFMRYINDKVPYRYFFRRIIHNISVYRFKRNILNGSPSFNILWQMADFIKLSERVFFYSNTTEGLIYSSNNYAAGENGFIARDDNVKIIVKLYKDTKKVVVDIWRLSGSNTKTILTFTQDEWDNTPTVYDEMLLELVIKIINHNVIYLFNKCYSKM